MYDRKSATIAALLVVVLAPAQVTNAGAVLTLSDFSSDETSAAELDATLSFAALGSTLTLTATNDTPENGGFDVNAIYFNARSNVSGLMLSTVVDGWTLLSSESADGFGRFDFALINDMGNDPTEIGARESLAFTFDVLGTGPFADTDFTTGFSRIPPGDMPALAAAKFVNGPNDDSAFGAVVPEPTTTVLTLIGVAMIGAVRRRRR